MSNEDSKDVRENIWLRFIGSCRLMPFSLDKLAFNLDDDQFKKLREFYEGDEVFRLMGRKGVYPYQNVDT